MKLKTLIPLTVIAMILGWRVGAQTNATRKIAARKNEFKTILGPNWVMMPFAKEVDGQVYDPRYSNKWKESTGLPNYIGDVEVDEIIPRGVICSVYLADNAGGRNFKKNIVIYNYPNPNELTVGAILHAYACMRVANYRSGSVSYEAYDCGTPYVKPLPVVKSVKVKMTNLPAISSTNSMV